MNFHTDMQVIRGLEYRGTKQVELNDIIEQY